MEDLKQKLASYSPFIKQNLTPLALGLLGLILLVYGLIMLIGSNRSGLDEVIFEAGQSGGTQAGIQKIAIDVEGAVIRPGVYSLALGARVKDALVEAGGLAKEADRKWIEKNVNLANKLTDGVKIYIPRVGEFDSSALDDTFTNGININSASIGQLDTLPGVGKVTAQKIINSRPYSSIDDLIVRKIVTEKVFLEIKDKIKVY